MFKDDVTKETLDSLLEEKKRTMRLRSLSYKWGGLSQVNESGVEGTKTIKFISRKKCQMVKR